MKGERKLRGVRGFAVVKNVKSQNTMMAELGLQFNKNMSSTI